MTPALLCAQAAQATVTVTPPSPWTPYNGTVYYAASAGLRLDTAAGYGAFDFSTTAAADASDRYNMLVFDVYSDKTFTVSTGQELVIMVQAATQSGGKVSVPITYAGTADCVDQSNCQYTISGSGGRLFAARYAQQATLRIGVYLEDICEVVHTIEPGAYASGCTTDATSVYKDPASNSNTPSVFTLTFYVGVAADATSGITIDSSTESGAINVSTHSVAPTMVCPTDVDKAGFYFPGDGEIQVTPTVFAASPRTDAGSAPVDTLLVIGSAPGTVVTNSTFAESGVNAIFGRFWIGDVTKALGGFVNTTNGTDHQYELQFALRDRAGVMTGFDCALSPVQTSEIQGFLSKGNCFIATAAFRDTDHPGVELLRRFRDRVLREFAPGRAFVRWYYRNSPPAAEWLLRHPVVRVPVLGLLLPLEILAWVLLHPILLLIPALSTVGALSWVSRVRRSRAQAVPR